MGQSGLTVPPSQPCRLVDEPVLEIADTHRAERRLGKVEDFVTRRRPLTGDQVHLVVAVEIDLVGAISAYKEDNKRFWRVCIKSKTPFAQRATILQKAAVVLARRALIEVAVKHAAPTPAMTVEITATVTVVEGRKVAFEVAAKDEGEPIGGSMRASSSMLPRPWNG